MTNRLYNELNDRDFNFSMRFSVEDVRQGNDGANREKVTFDYCGIEVTFFVLLSARGLSIDIKSQFFGTRHPAQIHIDYNGKYRIQFDPDSLDVVGGTDRNYMQNLKAAHFASAELCEALLLIDEHSDIEEAIKANIPVLTQHFSEQ
ncbi:hypothetical protein OTK49_20875 [Vibrio coralliirubri]|uniref:hypothetical protein n=1 Tax=Vibrio coralliirubri TaxID=1516159 RepID=UPI0022836D11|nr:hypothetical protein [Vibrio coralliirubri]MCY9864973.1 hypothetical protein [Vibrio coralliirubri]